MKRGIIAKVCSILLILVIFGSLLVALLVGGTVPEGQLPVLGIGLLAYSLAIFAIILSSRPKVLEKGTSLGFIYTLHAVAGSLLLTTGLIHGIMGFINSGKNAVEPWVMPTGIAALVLFLLIILVGSLGLSGKVKLKKKMKREVAVGVHRLSLLATIVIFGHLMGITYLRSNVVLLVLAGVYLAIALICFIVYTVRGRVSQKHTVKVAEKVNDDVHHIVLSSNTKELSYGPGQYAFFRFTKSSLPKESHPFSIVSLSGDIEILAKESGDFTRRLSEAKAGDIVAVEGPYGNFFSEASLKDETPIVLLAGGIGITPFLSALRYIKEKGIKKEVHLLWGVTKAGDAFLVDELEELKKSLPSFSYSIAYSKEAPNGKTRRVDLSFMEENGITPLFSSARFYVCGPAGFNAAMIETLKAQGVDKKRIALEEFSF